MGEIIRVTCSQCDLNREEFVGVGMLAIGQELCACYRCRRLVRKKFKWDTQPDSGSLRCPYCRLNIKPIQDEALCPLCDGNLQVEFNGDWD